MEPGGFPGLQNQCDLTASGWVGSIPIHSRQRASQMSTVVPRFLRCRFLVLAYAMSFLGPAVRAQRPDSAAVAVRATTSAQRRDSLRPPLSPRRAFLYSALVPGSAQSIFGRHRAAALMLLVEAISISMITESAGDLREARRMRGDSLVVTYVGSTGQAATELVERRFDDGYVHTRQSHVEDWIAFLVANHLFSGADAFVAANLWDVPAQLSVRATPRGAVAEVAISW